MKKIYFFLFLLITTGINAQWKYCSLPEGGQMTDLLHTGTTLLAGSAYNGIYWSTDNGNNWQRATINAKKAIHVVEFIVHGSAIFAVGNGVFKSVDGGKNWTILKDVLFPPYIRSLLISGDTLYAGSHKSIYQSFDNGVTWKTIPVLNTIKPISFFSLLATGNTLLAATNEGLYTSIDKGKNWKPANSDLPVQHTISLKRVDNTLFVLSSTNLYSSTNNGLNWIEHSDGLPTSTSYLGSIWITQDTMYVTSSDGLYFSADLGVHWTKLGTNPPINSISSCTSSSGKLFISTVYGIYTSDDNAATWKETNKNINALEVYSLAQNSTTLFAASDRGIFASEDDGTNWKLVYNRDNDPVYTRATCFTIVTNGNTIYAGQLDGVIVSTDNGVSWKHLDASPYIVNDLALDGTSIFAATDFGLFHSTDGTSWTALEPAIFNNVIVYWVSVKENAMYAGTSDGMYLSRDKGVSWTEINNGIPDNSFIGFIVNNNNEVITGTWQGEVFQSTDYGSNWKSISSSVPDKTFFMERVGADLFANTRYGGLFVSTDNSKSWIDIQDGAPYAYSSRVLKRKDRIFVSTIGSSLWYRNADELPSGIIEQLSSSPLYIYPNPGSGIFNVISAYRNSAIEVCNMLGAVILKTQTQADNTTVIDLQGQPKGVYIVRIITQDGQIWNQKLVVE